MTEITPAILSNDISDFRQKYAELFALSHLFRTLHVDFADGEFVGARTVLPADLKFLSACPFVLMAHFMTFHPFLYFHDAKQAGFSWTMFHYEAFDNHEQIEHAIAHARHIGLKPGLVVNPETPLVKVGQLLALVELVQLMGIRPGAQGREFIPATLEKIKELRALSKNVIIAVDGGMKVGIARQCAAAGANMLIAGSAILRAEDEEEAIEVLKEDMET